MIACKMVNQVSVMRRNLRALILRNCNLGSAKARNQVLKHSTTKKGTEQTLGDFFNLKYDFKKKSGDVSTKKGGRFLLCIDQADALIENDIVKFEKFLSQMTRQCKNLKIVVAAATDMNQHSNIRKMNTNKKIPTMTIEAIDKLKLQPLDSSQSVKMFSEKAGLTLDREPQERRAFNTAFINFIKSDLDY